MLWALVVILLIAWMLGFTVFSVGSLVHVLLVIAVVVVLYNLLVGKRPVP